VATVVLFHHAQGLTPGVHWFADELRSAGHDVVTPDLYDGETFDSLPVGVAYAEQIGMEALAERGAEAVADLPGGFVVAGFSLGVMPAQRVAQTRPGVRGAILYHGAVPPEVFGGWPDEVPVQAHAGASDDWGDLDVAEQLVAQVPDGELFVYPTAGHLVADNSLDEFEPQTAALILGRTTAFLDRVG